jgi:hypothetical protein
MIEQLMDCLDRQNDEIGGYVRKVEETLNELRKADVEG